ncbi:MAG: MarR family transcriptional regulator [Nocardioides sp.]|uniref:MarR family winged helix-turn-helix transcriptional regulator n=1 Tax=Nocardioides sp. TaxID=35761 RepID=UPI0039E3F93D
MTRWLTRTELTAWVRLAAVLELLPAAIDAQLRRDSDLTHFEYYALAMLSEAPGHTLPLNSLARQTNATLPRLSHVVRRLEERGLIERHPSARDARVTDARLTEHGWAVVERAAPGHVATVRAAVVDPLTEDQIGQLREIAEAILGRIDAAGAMREVYHRYDE